MSEKPVRVRIAPSPTGALHMGTARTALFNWLFAKKHNGTFILRIEDTDKERSKPEFEKNIIDGLAWLKITYEEFYRQSDRASQHTEYLQRLLKEGNAFFCEHSVEELENEAVHQRSAKEPPRHICTHRDEKRTAGIIRLRNDASEKIIVKDIVRGDIAYDAELLGDFSLARSITDPLYNFVVVVDDHDMRITHVIRGEDHLSNTPKQILIGRALGFAEPQWAHLPLLLGSDRSKLSKRHGALSVLEYRALGYLPDALINFMVLLGWHPKDEAGEVLDHQTMVQLFDLTRVQKGGAIASLEKLDWLNHEYLKKLSPKDLLIFVKPFLQENTTKNISEEKLLYALGLLQERVSRLTDFEERLLETVTTPEYPKELLLWRGKLDQETARQNLDEIYRTLSDISSPEFTPKAIEVALATLIDKSGKGSILWPLRAALSGKEASLGPYDLAYIMGKERALLCIESAKKLLT